MMLAARHPEMINKVVTWGAAAYITEVDVELNKGMTICCRVSDF